jgi:hypothetical protein
MKTLESYENSQEATTDLPFGAFSNETSAGSDDGTEVVAQHMQDLYYALYQVLQLAGFSPNGSLENGSSQKQFLSALSNVSNLLYNETTTYKKGAVCFNISGNNTIFYKSKVDNNTAALSNTTNWAILFSIDNSGILSNAKLNSPALSGTPTAPTAASTTNNTQIATTAFVKAAVSQIISSTAIIPNYSSGQNAPTGFVAPSNGWLQCTARLDSYQSHVYINGVKVFAVEPQWLNDWSGWRLYGMCLIGAGQTVSLDGNATATFFPFIG